MERNVQIGLAVALAAAVGFLVALLLLGNRHNNSDNAVVTNGTTTTATTAANGTTTTTTQSTTDTGAQSPAATTDSCIKLWNQPNNRGAQTALMNIAAQQPIQVHVGSTSDVPPQCLITVLGSTGNVFVFPEGGGTTFPYAPVASETKLATIPTDQRKANALEQRDGTLGAH